MSLPPLRVSLAASLVVVLVIGGYLVLHARSQRAAERDTVESYLRAWSARDYAAMYDDLDADVRDRTTARRFAAVQGGALTTATASTVEASEPKRSGDGFDVRVQVRTRVFGTFVNTIRVPIAGSGSGARVAWTRAMAFPGLRGGESLSRTTDMPARAAILARDGSVLAQGSSRTSPNFPNVASQVVGSMGDALPADRTALRRLGVPASEKVGTTGLERILNAQLVGTPGGTLKAGDRTLRRVAPRKAPDVRSSISVPVVKALVQAQEDAPSEHGAVALDARTGEVLGYEGQAFSLRQPPGSTMKIVTASAALSDGVAETTTQYPKETESKGPIIVQNSDEESCGGTLVDSFAHSCNSVFVPLGGKLGSDRLVAMAERFGFNKPIPGLPAAMTSTIPMGGTSATAAQEAIGQGQVQATPVEIALMGATVANGGKQPRLTFVKSSATARTRTVLSTSVARDMQQLMLAVVRYGTGKAAAVPGALTAGKTGTAEIRATQGAQCEQAAAPDSAPDAQTQTPPDGCGNQDGTSTDAWMSAYAPANGPGDKIAVGVLRAGDFQGGATAAPVAKATLAAALSSPR